jgi:methionine-rich copper-binding protein CopC
MSKSQHIISSVLLAGFGTFIPISSASAHTELVSSSPSAGEIVNVSQESISITFSEPPLVDGAAIVILNSTGEILESPAPTLDGATLSIPWPAALTPGQITVQWRASADDGHVISDEFGFNYTAAAEGGMAPSPSGSAATTEPTATETPVAMALETYDSPVESNNNLVVGIAITSLAGLVAASMFLRRSK